MAVNVPVEINLHQQSSYLTLKYENESFDLAAEYLRVYSPSAEVMGHGPGKKNYKLAKKMCQYKILFLLVTTQFKLFMMTVTIQVFTLGNTCMS